jgi:hypothetical protein
MCTCNSGNNNCECPPYDMVLEIAVQNGQIIRHQDCFAFMFTNVGDVTAWVNGMVVYPASGANALGDSRSVSGNPGQLYKGKIEVSFDPNTTGTNPAIEIVQLTKFK